MRGPADGFVPSRSKAFHHRRVDVTQPWIAPEGLHAGLIGGVYAGTQTGAHHGAGGVAMRGAHPLSEAVIQGVIQIKNDAANERPQDAPAHPAFRASSRLSCTTRPLG